MREIKYAVVHTAQFQGRNCDADMIDSWHTQSPHPGFRCIGYHVVVLNDRHDTKRDGTVELGRPEDEVGAHVKGINTISLGLCVVGDGTVEPMTAAQEVSVLNILRNWCDRYGLVPNDSVIGHYEVNSLIDEGLVDSKYRTDKTCPGSMIDMDHIRDLL